MSAMIDPDRWPHEGGIAGFGMTLADALRDLADNLDREVGLEPEPPKLAG